jgi:hypothetical protein
VRRFERPTFTLATCKHTDAAASTESISCGDGKGVTRTDTTGVQDAGLIRLLEAWPTLPEDRKQSILELLAAGADVNARAKTGTTPLMFAARHNKNNEVIPVLLKAGADVKAKNSDGKTALDYAKGNERINGTPAHWKLRDASFD